LIRDWAIWFLVVLAAMTLTLVFIKRAKKLAHPEASVKGMPFDLDHLRALRDNGEITIQQYESLRGKAIQGLVDGKTPGEAPAGAGKPN